MAVKSKEATASSSDLEFVITRVFDAPRELVFEAWTDPERLKRWWGPHGFTNPVCNVDCRPGGSYRIVMRGPDGTEHPAKGVYREVVRPERLVMTIDHSELPDAWHDLVNPNRPKGRGRPALEVLSTVTFEERDGKTTLTIRTRFESAAIRDAFLKIGMAEGWSQSLERLAKLVTDTTDREIVSTRVINATRGLVFKAFSDPEHLAQWWGPKGFRNTFHTFDLRPGGIWRFVMHGPEGVDYHNESVFVEVVEPERIVFQHLKPMHRFQMTMTFAEHTGKTTLTWSVLFESAAECGKVRSFISEANEQNFDRLKAHLAKMASTERPFIITRVFDAPRDLVWKAWTERERLMQWFGPKGFTRRAATLDFRPGGVFHYCLRSPDGHDMWGKFVYREIVAPERIVLVNSFSDEQGSLTRHPMSPTWPLEMLSMTTFAEHEGRTTITVQWAPLNATKSEHKTFEAGHESMQQGWTGTLDQLADYLAKA